MWMQPNGIHVLLHGQAAASTARSITAATAFYRAAFAAAAR
jgi:hypothetical protein